MMRTDYNGCAAKCRTLLNITSFYSYDDPAIDVFECCYYTCLHETMGFIADGEYIQSGLISSFAASIDFDSGWMNIIESSVKRCFDTVPFDIKYDCQVGITVGFYHVIQCAFLQLFLQCPYPTGLEICKLAIKYVEECYTY